MNPASAFLVGLGLTTGLVVIALLYMRNPLQVILTDLCGTAERARFWTAFSNITLFLVPFALALNHRPVLTESQPLAFTIGDQLESALMGLIISVLILGVTLSRFIPRTSVDSHERTRG